MNYKEFCTKVRKAEGKGKKAKVNNSFGVYDCYKHIRKNGWYNIGRPLKEHEFYSIVRGVNDLLAENIAAGTTVHFPAKMGRLELRKLKCGVSFVNGKLKIGYPIDWNSTLKLWFEDEEARNNKTLLRSESNYTYRVKYCKHDANYENKSFYEFSLNRFVKQALKDNIEKHITDTLW